MLCEVEKVAEKFLLCPERELSACHGSSELLQELSCRLGYTQNSWASQAPVIRLRRTLYSLASARVRPYNSRLAERLQFEVGESWLRSARLARQGGQLQEAYSFTTQPNISKHIEFFLESAKLSWARSKKTTAIETLSKGIADAFPTIEDALNSDNEKDKKANLAKILSQLDLKEKDVLCEGRLLLAKYMEEAANVSTERISKIYSNTKLLVWSAKSKEEVFFNYAQSLDKQIQKLYEQRSKEEVAGYAELISACIFAYCHGMKNGPTHLHHSLPRMLSLWLDFADLVTELLAKNKENKNSGADPTAQIMTNSTLTRANEKLEAILVFLKKWIKTVPWYYFLTALPQVVSRICHQHIESYKLLSQIISSLLLQFKQQTFWHLISVSKNRNSTRKNRCKDIFTQSMKNDSDLSKFLNDAITFAGEIDKLCEIKTEKGTTKTSFKEILPKLPLLVNKSDFSPLLLPTQRNMTVILPTIPEELVESRQSLAQHEPFPAGMVCLERVENNISVMTSLVAPKKITFRGSDGHLHSFLAKPKDDLRRDCRLMDFNVLLNKLFKKDPEARKRNLQIRTYCVVPTSETNGLIEWVENLKGVRPIVLQLHKERGTFSSWAGTKFQTSKTDSLVAKKQKLLRCLEEQRGAVFSDWFVNTFPDPQSWLMARMAFTRTTAVMSMMGYIIGLGDRHLENINVDTTNGETFHVDMNALFNKGETMDVPEVVPFRLTHNIVDAFGPLGIEGPFRIGCQEFYIYIKD